MPRPNAGDDSNPRSGEGGLRRTAAQLAADSAFTGTYAHWDGTNLTQGGSTIPVGGGGVETVNTVAASGATLTLPALTTATIHNVTLTANCTLTFPAATAGATFTLVLTQDATGSRTVTWPGTAQWPAGTAPSLSTGSGKRDVLTFTSFSGTAWVGSLDLQDVR